MFIRIYFPQAAAVAVVACLTLNVYPGDFFVAPDGKDENCGSLDEPFASPTRALQAAREIKDEPVNIFFRGGRYQLTEVLILTPEDSRSTASPLSLVAYGDERPVLSAGIKLNQWSIDQDGSWRAKLECVANDQWNFGQLFVNGQRRLRPRVPDDGYFSIAGSLPPSETNAQRGFDRFRFTAGEISEHWSNLNDIEVIAFHRWSTSRMRIAAIEPRECVVNFTGPTRGLASWTDFETGHRYFLVNVKEHLKQPGQWYLDRSIGELTYLPYPGETPDTAEVIAPFLDQSIVFAGDTRQHNWVENIRFVGLTIAHTNWSCDSKGESFPQAAINTQEAVAAVGARHIRFERCAIVHTGGYAMGFGAGCRHIRVEGCELVDLGGGGIKIGTAGGSQSWGEPQVNPDDPETRVEHITVRDCTIAHAGRIHPAAVGVWIGHASHNTIEHNHIYDLYYSGLSVGWTWGYETPSRAHHNDIGWNHVHQIGQRVLSDMGGIYTLGVSPGTRIHHNIFHDIESYDYGGWGLYTDEGSTGILLDHNLVYNTKDGSFHQHYGRDNHITNNILVNSQLWQIRRSRKENHRSFLFDRNIVFWTLDTPLLGSNWRDGGFDIDHNLYWHDGRDFDFSGLSLDQWREKGYDVHSLIADPLFVNPKANDFRLQENSPAHNIGFEPWDFTRAGRLTPPTITQDIPPVPATYQ